MYFIDMNNKKYILIIGGIVLLIIFLYVMINRVRMNIGQDDNLLVTTTPSPLPTITPVVINYIVPTLAPEIRNELLYPIKFEDITVEYKSRSGTFLIYYQGDQNAAVQTVNRFFTDLNINQDLYKIEYRTLDTVTLPPRVEVE